jgi:hypothetical protein
MEPAIAAGMSQSRGPFLLAKSVGTTATAIAR